MQGEGERTRLLFRLVVSLLLLLPLLGNLLAIALGWHVFFLDDARTQFVWGTLILIWGLWPARRRNRTAVQSHVPLKRGLWAEALVILLFTAGAAAYLVSAWHTFFQPQSLNGVLPVYYLQAGSLVSLALLGRLLAAFRQR